MLDKDGSSERGRERERERERERRRKQRGVDDDDGQRKSAKGWGYAGLGGLAKNPYSSPPI